VGKEERKLNKNSRFRRVMVLSAGFVFAAAFAGGVGFAQTAATTRTGTKPGRNGQAGPPPAAPNQAPAWGMMGPGYGMGYGPGYGLGLGPNFDYGLYGLGGPGYGRGYRTMGPGYGMMGPGYGMMGRGYGMGYGMMGPGYGRGYAPMRFSGQLNLTSNERQQIQDILQKHRSRFQALQNQELQARKELSDAMFATPPNDANIKSAIDRLSAEQAKMAIEAAQVHSQIFSNVLTKEQRDRADQLHTQAEQRMEQRLQQFGQPK
jgi:Spy/CpxP family protein refolding chaperone